MTISETTFSLTENNLFSFLRRKLVFQIIDCHGNHFQSLFNYRDFQSSKYKSAFINIGGLDKLAFNVDLTRYFLYCKQSWE